MMVMTFFLAVNLTFFFGFGMGFIFWKVTIPEVFFLEEIV